MRNYQRTFAQYYDLLTDNVDDKVGSEVISGFFRQYGNGGNDILDLACGTGNMTKRFCDIGYTVTGLDLSEDMLTVAAGKCAARFIRGDMRHLGIHGSFDFCACCLDSINHLETVDDWRACFASVAEALKDGGVFVFDVNTVYKHNEILAGNAFIFDEEDFFLAWDNEALGHNQVRILLDFFVKEGDSYARFSEEFTETAFETDVITGALSPYFEVLKICDADTLAAPTAQSERLYFVCKRK